MNTNQTLLLLCLTFWFVMALLHLTMVSFYCYHQYYYCCYYYKHVPHPFAFYRWREIILDLPSTTLHRSPQYSCFHSPESLTLILDYFNVCFQSLIMLTLSVDHIVLYTETPCLQKSTIQGRTSSVAAEGKQKNNEDVVQCLSFSICWSLLWCYC